MVGFGRLLLADSWLGNKLSSGWKLILFSGVLTSFGFMAVGLADAPVSELLKWLGASTAVSFGTLELFSFLRSFLSGSLAALSFLGSC